MEEKLQGLTLEMKLDSLGVQEGMKGLKRQLGVVNSEMKANLSAFGKSEKSMAKYEAQIKGLSNRLEVQKQMFNQAESELKKLNSDYKTAQTRIKGVEKAYLNLAEANKKDKVALDKSNQALKENNSELKKAENQYKRTNQRRNEAWQKLKQLRQAEKDLKNNTEATTSQLKRANDAVQKQATKHKELVQRYKEEGAQVQKLRSQNKELSNSNDKVKSTYDKTNTELKQAENEYKQLNNTIKNHSANLAKAEKAVNSERTSLNNLERSIGKVKADMSAFNKEQLISNSHFTKTANQADNVSKKFGVMGQKMTSAGRSMTVGVTTPLTLGLGAAVKKSADFEEQMSKVGAVSQASGRQLKAMSDEAVMLGAKTSKSASEVAKGMNELAQLGFNANQVMKAMPGVISAAEASGADMATTAQVMASSINSFNLKAENSGHVADVLATAANDSAADINYMGDALKYAGTPAHSLGISLEDTSAAIEVMSNAGLEGSQAGTALRASFIRLSNPTKKSQKAMDELGVSLTNSKGKFVGMPKLIEQFRDGMKGMTKEQKLANVAQIVGTEAASGFLALIDAGPNKINKYSKSLQNSDGASAKAAKRMRDNLKGALEQLGGAFESLGIKIGSDLTPAIRGAAGFVQKFTEGFTALPGWVRKSAIALTILTATIGPMLVAGGLLAGAVSKAAQGYASLNRQMAINTVETKLNAKANTQTAGSLALSGKASKGASGWFGRLGGSLLTTIDRFGGLGRAISVGIKFLGKLTIPLTIATTIFGVAYEKMDWFRRGFSDMGKLVNQVGESIDFSWIPNMGKAWDDFKNDMAKGLQDGLLFKGIHKLFNGIHSAASKASDKVNVLGKGVSKETKSALGTYVKYSDQSDKIFEQIRYNHGQITKKQANELISINKKMSSELISQLEKRKAKELKLDHDVLDGSKALSEKRKQAILQKATEEGNIRIRKAKELNKRIEALEEKAAKNGKLSKSETKELQRLYEQRNNLAVKSLSKGEKEQQRIMSRMSANRRAMSIKEASETIQESIKARKQAIKDAKKKYDAKVDEINQMVGLSKKEKNKLLNEAQDQYNKDIKKANAHHRTTLNNVKKSNKNVEKEINLSNGKVMSGMQKWFHGLTVDSKKAWDKMGKNAQHFGKLMSGAGKWFKGLGSSASKAWGNVNATIAKHSKSSYNSAKNWLGKTTKNAVSNFKDARNSAGKHWGNISSTISSKTKTAYGHAKSWLGKTTSNAISNFKSAKNSAGKHWGSMSSTIASKSKHIFGSVKTWFGKTSGNARGNLSNMLGNARKYWNRISDTSSSNSKSVFRSTSKWFGNAFKSLKGNMGNMLSNARSRWNKISDTAWSNSKSVYKGTSKWFGNAYSSLKSWTGSMYDKAHDRFDRISSDAWSNAKSVYKGFKTWLSNTLSWIRSVGKDMGDAAADLGKSVANKAIAGLNGMIGGINKISKAITDKNLIKPIPTLSTGTYSGASVATDSNGGVSSPTLAVVNDRGSGNAAGGGVQEVIHRADGSLEAPQGRNTIVHLNKGDGVINARDTKKMQNMGMIPRFAGGSKKKNWLENITDSAKDVAQSMLKGASKGTSHAKDVAKDKTKNVIDKAKEIGTDALESAEDAAMGIWGGIKGVTKDVGEFLEHPGKLVDKVMDFMKVNFGQGANTTVTMAKLSYEKLKKSLVDKVKQWFEDYGGDGDGGYIKYLDNITTPYSPNGPPPGYAFHWAHPGIDLPYHYEKVQSTTSGIARTKDTGNVGFGHHIVVEGKPYDVIYGHLSKWLVKNGEHVHPGTVLGISGSTGSSTGPHLHYEMNKHGFGSMTGHSIDPVKWLKTHNGSKGGGSRAASAWRPEVIKALKMNGLPASSAYVNAWIRQIQSESGGNAGAHQGVIDINSGGNEAQGLVQVVPSTFRANKFPGHGNILNGLDNLLAGIRYAKRTYGGRMLSVIGHGHGYENGGLVTKHQIAEIGEGNKPEMVVPLTKRNRAVQLIEQAMRYVGMDSKSTNVTVNNDNSLIEKLLSQMVAMSDRNNRLTEAIVGLLKQPSKSTDPRTAEQLLSQLQGDRYSKTAFNMGL